MKHHGAWQCGDIPVNRLVFVLFAYLPLAPLLVGSLFLCHAFAPETTNLWYHSPDGLAAIALYLVFPMLYLWRNKPVFLMAWFVVLASLWLIASNATPWRAWPVEPNLSRLDGTLNPGLARAEVFCNGLSLGHTPITLSSQDFYESVEPVRHPPCQKRLFVPENLHPPFSRRDYAETLFEAIPAAPFVKSSFRGFDLGANPVVRAPYWWRFERDGCVGAAPPFDRLPYRDSHDGMAARQWFIPTSTPPFDALGPNSLAALQECRIIYPSAELHAACLLHLLRQAGYQADANWIAHVRRYLNVLFEDLNAAAEQDARIMPVLEAVVRAEFDMEEPLSQAGIRRVWERILASTEQDGAFLVPSPESMAIDLLAERLNDLVAREFGRQLAQFSEGLRAAQRAASLTRYGKPDYSAKPSVRFQPVRYAILTLAPPALLNHIAYEARRYEFVAALLTTYALTTGLPPNALIEGMQREWLTHLARKQRTKGFDVLGLPPARRHPFANWLNRPTLDPTWFIRPIFISAPPMDIDSYTRTISAGTDVDLRMLSVMILATESSYACQMHPLLAHVRCPLIRASFELPKPEPRHPLGEKELEAQRRKEEVAVRMGSHYFLLEEGSFGLDATLSILAHRPNPYLDEFLCECLQRVVDDDIVAQDIDAALLFQALARCDTSPTWDALDDVWERNPLLPTVQRPAREVILEALAEMQAFLPAFEPWTARMAQLEDAALRVKAVKVLGRTGTAEAEALLRAWGEDPDISVREAALAERRRLAQELQDAHALIAGAMHPDELLPPAVAYVWDGESYVPES